MKIIVLHGNDTLRSYERLTTFIKEAKKRGWDIVNNIIEDTPSLFGTEKLIVIRDIKIIKDSDLAVIKKIPGTLVIYSQSKIPALNLKKFNTDKGTANYVEELFELPQKLWKFLDNVTIKGLHELVETEAIEFVFAMIVWKLKQKYIKSPNEKTAKIIQALADIDAKSKVGKANLLLSLDLLISKQLK